MHPRCRETNSRFTEARMLKMLDMVIAACKLVMFMTVIGPTLQFFGLLETVKVLAHALCEEYTTALHKVLSEGCGRMRADVEVANFNNQL